MKKIFPNHKRSGGEEPLLLAVCAHERLGRELSAVVKLSAEGITEIWLGNVWRSLSPSAKKK